MPDKAAQEESKTSGNYDAQRPVVPFALTPSAGTWLQRRPFRVARPWYYEDLPKSRNNSFIGNLQHELIARDEELQTLARQVEMLAGLETPQRISSPMPGTRAQKTDVVPFAAYYHSNFASSCVQTHAALYAKFNVQNPAAPVLASPDLKQASSPLTAAAVPFKYCPSVGSWLAKRPPARYANSSVQRSSSPMQTSSKQESTDTHPGSVQNMPFTLRPSVGTWLSLSRCGRSPTLQTSGSPSSGFKLVRRQTDELLAMDHTELIHGFKTELAQRDDEITDLKRQLQERQAAR